jgi:hypothetical protein
VRSSAERIDAARAGETPAQERFDVEQRRYDVGLSTTFLVTQAQRDLLQAQVNFLQTTLDYESSLVNFEAVQQAPPLTLLGPRPDKLRTRVRATSRDRVSCQGC